MPGGLLSSPLRQSTVALSVRTEHIEQPVCVDGGEVSAQVPRLKSLVDPVIV